MGKKFVDCFMLMGTALSLQRGDQSLTEMGRPVLKDVFATVVNVSITLQDIRFVEVENMEVQFTFLLHQRWLDPRLGPNPQTNRLATTGQIWRPWLTATEGEMRASQNEVTQYWRGYAPEGSVLHSERVVLKTLCSRDLRKFPFDSQKCAIKLGSCRTNHLATIGQIWRPWLTATEGEMRASDNEVTQYWRGFAPEGSVLHSERVVLKTLCSRDLRKFPFDSQKCAIKLGSYRFPIEEIELIWSKVPVEILTGEILKEFKLIDVTTYSEIEIRLSGNFTVLVVQLTIKRLVNHYLFCVFLPCLIIILISYFTFWISPDIINIRYFISTINLCFVFYLYHHSVCSTAPVPYLKALDISVLISIIFVFITLLENLIIDINFRREEYEEYGSRFFHKIKPSYNSRYRLLDRISCVLYPMMLICVSLFYWMSFIL